MAGSSRDVAEGPIADIKTWADEPRNTAPRDNILSAILGSAWSAVGKVHLANSDRGLTPKLPRGYCPKGQFYGARPATLCTLGTACQRSLHRRRTEQSEISRRRL